MDESDIQQLAESILMTLRDPQLRDLDDFLLPRSHHLVQAELLRAEQIHHRRMAADEARKLMGKPKSVKWPETHARVCHSLCIKGWLVSSQVTPTLKHVYRVTCTVCNVLCM